MSFKYRAVGYINNIFDDWRSWLVTRWGTGKIFISESETLLFPAATTEYAFQLGKSPQRQVCLAVFAKTPLRKRFVVNPVLELAHVGLLSRTSHSEKADTPATNCCRASSFEIALEEANEAHQMSSAHTAQPTKADELGSPRTDGRGTEPCAGNPQLNPYSCLSCRRKKKKCDRVYPCINCRKAGADCLFVPRRPSTRPKTTQGMLERLQHLEGVISHLRENYVQGASQPSSENTKVHTNTNIEEADTAPRSDSTNSKIAKHDAVAELGTELGRLAVGDGRSRYINSSFWASLDEEICANECYWSLVLIPHSLH